MDHSGDIEIDMPTHDRLIAVQDIGELTSLLTSVLASVTAAMVGTFGRETAAEVLRKWADDISYERPVGHG
jgi:hypothetical protein